MADVSATRIDTFPAGIRRKRRGEERLIPPKKKFICSVPMTPVLDPAEARP